MTSASFSDRFVGWAVGTRTILRSLDGGNTWIDQTDTVEANIIGSLQAVTALSATRGVIVGGVQPQISIRRFGPVYRRLTTDGGTTWALTPFDPGNSLRSLEAELQRMCFTNAGIGIACGEAGSIFSPGHVCALSGDRGGSWLDITDRARGGNVACVGDATLWVVRRQKRLLQSTDGGLTWIDRSDTLPTDGRIDLHAITFVTEALGWAVGTGEGQPRRPLILHTRDAGGTWTRQTVPPTVSGPLQAVQFVDARNGIAVGASGTSDEATAIGLFTTDGGTQWQIATFPPNTPGLRDLAVVP